jgi:hypothetical protein
MNTVPFEWAMRDIAQGWRGILLIIIAAVPALFLALIHFTVEPIPAADRGEVGANLITIFLVPPLIGITAILVGGSVLSAPQEDGTLIYQLTRPMQRVWVGLQRSLAATLTVGVGAVLAGLFLMIPLGPAAEILDALPGLFLAGLAFGALYGFVVSLHRYAVGVAIIHLLAERALASVPAESIQRLTLTWHAWGSMPTTAATAAREGVIEGSGGDWWILLGFTVLAVGATGALYARKAFHLGLPEA